MDFNLVIQLDQYLSQFLFDLILLQLLFFVPIEGGPQRLYNWIIQLSEKLLNWMKMIYMYVNEYNSHKLPMYDYITWD